MESMNEKFQKELEALKCDINSIKDEILNETRARHTHNSSIEEVKGNKDVGFK